jgi:hypothetical protein
VPATTVQKGRDMDTDQTMPINEDSTPVVRKPSRRRKDPPEYVLVRHYAPRPGAVEAVVKYLLEAARARGGAG